VPGGGGDAARALARFTEQRKEHADAIAEMALENFIEMRDRVASPAFRARKKVEHALHALFPEMFMPLYNMVSFSTIPYAEARRRASEQARILRWAGMGAFAIVGGVLALAILYARS
jgi:kynurenine 3-monooxygenase